MPYKSEAQRRKFHADPKLRPLARKWDKEEKVSKGALVPLITSDDPNFNHKVAQQAAEMVMKCHSDDEAEVFTYLVMADIVENDIEANQRTLQRHLDSVVLKRLERTKRALLSTVAKSDNPQAVEYAEALTKIEKRITDPEGYLSDVVKAYKNPYQTGAYQFEESDFRRDPRTGRFQTKVSVNPSMKPLNEKQAQNLGIKGADKTNSAYAQLSPQKQAQFQQEYMQVANFLNVAAEMGDHDSYVRVENKAGQRHWRKLNGTPKVGDDWDPKTEKVIGVEARPTGQLTLGGASFGLVNSLGARDAGTINRADTQFGGFANDWSSPTGDKYNSNQRLYSRVQTGSKFLADVAPYDSRLQLAARFGRAVGEHGPQAEKVLGPSVRRTAYRYRGVEKTPDREAMAQFGMAVGDASKVDLSEEQRKTLRSRQTRAVTNLKNQKATATKTPVEAVKLSDAEIATARGNVERAFMERAKTQARGTARDAGAAALTAYLTERDEDTKKLKRGPDKDLFDLQLEAGGTPPSEGFIIDRNGKVVTQAIGYGDDHYLPFNLKNLKKLNGGQYVRTRSVGGPTSEDIYTGLMTGAKSITVVSRSGTFKVDFADDFTGKRRYNDKAKRMIGRYEKLLDAVQSEEVPRNQQVAAAVKARITREVNTDMAALTPRERRQEVTRLTNEYKDDLASTDKDEFRALVEADAENLPDQDKRVYIAQAMNDWDRHSEFKFRLNGLGYADALKALEEQFPYYMKTSYAPTKELERFESERDKGYVEPGRLRPTAANAGWRGTKTNPGTGFISASQTQYQRGKYGAASDAPQSDIKGRPSSQETRPDENGGDAAGATADTPDAPKSPRQELAAKETKAKFDDATVNLVSAIREHTEYEGAVSAVPILGMSDPEKIKTYLKDKDNARKATEGLQTIKDMLGTSMPEKVQTAYTQYAKVSGLVGRVEYDPKLALTRDRAPFLFSGAAYEMGADPSLVQNEADRIDAQTKPVSSSGLKLSNMDDADLNNEIDVLVKLESGMKQLREMDGPEKIKQLEEWGIDTKIPGVTAILEGEKLGSHAKNVQRMRALNLNRGERVATATIPKTKTLEAPTEEENATQKKKAEDSVDVLRRALIKLDDVDTTGKYTGIANALANQSEEFKQIAGSAESSKAKLDVASANSEELLLLAHAIINGFATPEQLEAYNAKLDRGD